MFFSMESIKWPAIKVQKVTNTSAAENCQKNKACSKSSKGH